MIFRIPTREKFPMSSLMRRLVMCPFGQHQPERQDRTRGGEAYAALCEDCRMPIRPARFRNRPRQLSDT